MKEEEILVIIKKFATSAKLAKDAGFTGVQIHGAHGYLVSQFFIWSVTVYSYLQQNY